MATTHIVKQGENLFRIARKYKLGDWRDIYNHVNNAEFKKLRPNPDVIMPGDELYIPDAEPKWITIQTGKTHRFVYKRPKQKLKIKLQTDEDQPLEKIRAAITIGDQTIEAQLKNDGLIEADIYNIDAEDAQLDIFMDQNSNQPSHSYHIRLSHLDPIDELSGVQARLNAIGFDCGQVDGVMGPLTQAAIKAFQAQHKLQADGNLGPLTKDALTKAYGC